MIYDYTCPWPIWRTDLGMLSRDVPFLGKHYINQRWMQLHSNTLAHWVRVSGKYRTWKRGLFFFLFTGWVITSCSSIVSRAIYLDLKIWSRLPEHFIFKAVTSYAKKCLVSLYETHIRRTAGDYRRGILQFPYNEFCVSKKNPLCTSICWWIRLMPVSFHNSTVTI